jgi:chromosome partitioning protein
MEAMLLAVINSKGGVGKTSTAVNLAAALAHKGRRVLLVDLDSQGSASFHLGVERKALSPGSAEVILDGLNARKAIRETSVESLDLLTGSMALASADVALADQRGRETRLRDVLAPVRGDYEALVLDCPPSLSLLPINALVAAEAFLVPVIPQYLALEGLVNLLAAVAQMRQSMGVTAQMLGLVPTLVDRRMRVTQEVLEMLRAHYASQVFRTEIPGSVRVAEAPSHGKTIFDYAPSSPGAVAYKHLAEEVLQRARNTMKDLRKDGKKEGRR